jgi:hypothetical protein
MKAPADPLQNVKCKPAEAENYFNYQLLGKQRSRLFLLSSPLLTMKQFTSWIVAALAAHAAGAALSHKLDGFTIREHADPAKRALLQKYVCSEPATRP